MIALFGAWRYVGRKSTSSRNDHQLIGMVRIAINFFDVAVGIQVSGLVGVFVANKGVKQLDNKRISRDRRELHFIE
jgi:hypothetical protein